MKRFKKNVFHNLPIVFSSSFSPDGNAVALLFEGVSLELHGRDPLQDNRAVSLRLPMAAGDKGSRQRLKFNIRGAYSGDNGNGFICYQLGDEKCIEDFFSLSCVGNGEWTITKTIDSPHDVLVIHLALFGNTLADGELLVTVDSVDATFVP